MIKTDREYQEAKKRLESEFKSTDNQRAKLKKSGLDKDQIKLALDPLISFAHQLKEEVEEYERLKRGDFSALDNLHGIGRMLVALRIFRGMKQTELAQKLGVTDSQISRDEANEYFGASIEKIQKVLEAMHVTLKTTVEHPFSKAG